MFKKTILLVSLLSYAGLAHAREDMPDHDITLFDLNVSASGVSIANPQVVANKVGYENQPHFIDNESLYFTRMDDVNADTWHWKNGVLTQRTKTLESEYSPTPIPFKKGAFSTIRVEHDNSQRLWQVNADGSFELLFKDVKPVGYHVWKNENVAMFILGEPHRLEISKLGQENTTVVDQSIGRCLLNVPANEKISYTVDVEGQHHLKLYDFDNGTSESLLKLPKQSQDYAWLAAGQLISSDSEQLLWTDTNDGNWKTVNVPKGTEFKGLSRIAVSPDRSKIAVVHLK